MGKYYIHLALDRFNIEVSEELQNSFLVRVRYHRWLGYTHTDAVLNALTDLKLIVMHKRQAV